MVLDTPHYGAGSTTYDIFSFNQPIVTLPGRFNIGRYTLACYRKMGLPDLIADSPEHYVELAVRVATDEDFRHDVRARIAERSDVLFDDREAVAEHVRFLREAVRRLTPYFADRRNRFQHPCSGPSRPGSHREGRGQRIRRPPRAMGATATPRDEEGRDRKAREPAIGNAKVRSAGKRSRAPGSWPLSLRHSPASGEDHAQLGRPLRGQLT